MNQLVAQANGQRQTENFSRPKIYLALTFKDKISKKERHSPSGPMPILETASFLTLQLQVFD